MSPASDPLASFKNAMRVAPKNDGARSRLKTLTPEKLRLISKSGFGRQR